MTSIPPDNDPATTDASAHAAAQRALREEEDAGVTRAYIALLFVALFAAAAYWAFDSFQAHNRTLECLAAHKQNCVPLDTSDVGH